MNLCFHGIGAPLRNLEPGEGRYWITVAQFHEMLSAIGDSPGVRLTFDDGNASDASIAVPALSRHGLTATFFMIAARLGADGSVSPSDLREFVRAGMVVGSHGMHHRSWRSLDDRSLRVELDDASALISAVTGLRVTQVACPFGQYDRRVLAALQGRGFERVYTVDEGAARAESWLQPRYTVRSSDTAATIERIVRGTQISLLAAAAATVKQQVKRWR